MSATRALAQRMVHQVAQRFAPECVPLFLSDGFKGYLHAILGHCGSWVHPERRQDKGPWPKPCWMPLPQLLYAQIIKQYRRRHVVWVTHRVVFGTLGAVNAVLAPLGRQINTAFVESLNLDIRQHVAAVGRRVTTLCQGKDGLRQQLALCHVYYMSCLTPAYTRPCRIRCRPTARAQSSGGGPVYRRADGLTDRVWSLRDVLLYRVRPWPQPQAV